MPTVRPELVEGNGWHTQDRLREGVAISLNMDCGFVGALLAAPFLGQGKPCPYGLASSLRSPQ